jgi:hypothetical protein
MARIDPQFRLRMPEPLHDNIKASADANGRSMNAEIVSRLSSDSETLLRDWFAGQAMSALIIAGHDMPTSSRMAYETADAMLDARERC